MILEGHASRTVAIPRRLETPVVVGEGTKRVKEELVDQMGKKEVVLQTCGRQSPSSGGPSWLWGRDACWVCSGSVVFYMVLAGPYVDLQENAGRRTQDAGGGCWMCETVVRGNHSTASLVDDIGQGRTPAEERRLVDSGSMQAERLTTGRDRNVVLSNSADGELVTLGGGQALPEWVLLAM